MKNCWRKSKIQNSSQKVCKIRRFWQKHVFFEKKGQAGTFISTIRELGVTHPQFPKIWVIDTALVPHSAQLSLNAVSELVLSAQALRP